MTPAAPADASAAPIDPDTEARHEMQDAPPFLGWNRIYLLVLGALAVEIIACWILTSAFQ